MARQTLRRPSATRGMRAFIEVPLATLGFRRPAERVHIKMMHAHHRGGVHLMVWSEGRTSLPLAAWLDGFEPEIQRPLRGGVGNVASVYCAKPHPIWERMLESLRIDGLILLPDGTARMRLEGDAAFIDWMAEALSGDVGDVAAPSSGPGNGRHIAPSDSLLPKLTDRQRDALVVAVVQGYYEVPRRTNQKQLAAMLGVSPASLSELLRRAESMVVEHHIGRLAPAIIERETAAEALRRGETNTPVHRSSRTAAAWDMLERIDSDHDAPGVDASDGTGSTKSRADASPEQRPV